MWPLIIGGLVLLFLAKKSATTPLTFSPAVGATVQGQTVSNGGANVNETPPPWGSQNDVAPNRVVDTSIPVGILVLPAPVVSSAPAGSGGLPVTITDPGVVSYSGLGGSGTGGATKVAMPLIA